MITRDFSKARRIVVKVGSSTLTHESGLLNLRRVERLVTVLSDIKNSGKQIILVSSGARGREIIPAAKAPGYAWETGSCCCGPV